MGRQATQVGTTRRGLYVTLGVACVGLGALGVVVPGLPTTVFVLLASYFFARSSPRLHRMLVEHPRLGPYLAVGRTREMPLRAKVISLAAMWGGIALCVAFSGPSLVVPSIVISLGLIGTYVLLFWVRTVPAGKRDIPIYR
jgi:uncharacterized membrane protein YbaN (DUF454 family)